MSTPFRLQLPCQLYEEMLNQARAELPNECCGLLAGRVEANGQLGRAVTRYPLINEAASPREFNSDGKTLIAAHKTMREEQLELLAIYHSHPTSAPIPSKTDLALNGWPSAMCLIISLLDPEPKVRGWWLGEIDYQEAEWEVMN